ncbi:hypothetical protein [Actinomadura sp. GTD37]|uniref:allene oxide cyclase barrel-like domain-containing protein n=1 Tax=Actinomadura sp. GTD37 TaxID=1778030 RepID=UPI0035C161C1
MRPRRARPVLSAVVLAAASGTAACGTNSAAAVASDPAPGCNVMDHLEEKIVAFSLNELGGPYPSLHDSATYQTRLYDSSGKQIATVYGKANIADRLPNGDLLEYSEETIELPAGTIESQGIYNVTQGQAHKWQFMPAIGTKGAYKGKMGKRSFKILKDGELLDAKIEVCPVK